MNTVPGATLRAFKDEVEPNAALSHGLFLDANIVIDIHNHELSMMRPSSRPEESDLREIGKRNAVLADFLRRAKIAGAQLFTTPFVLEEVFHHAAKRAFNKCRRLLSCNDNKEVRWKHPDEFTKATRQAVAGLRNTLRSLSKHSVVVKMYVGGPNESQRTLGSKTVEAFAQLLEKVPQLGGNDAFHVVTAQLLECEMFVSRDGDFRFVPDVLVYCENPASEVR